VPASLRMSISGVPRPFSCTAVIVGSVVMPQSIAFCCIAATNVGPAFTATGVILWVGTPLCVARYCVRKYVDDPRPVTPSLRPVQSAGERTLPATSLRHSSASPGSRSSWTTDWVLRPLPSRSRVWS
jgi:hypothetical protein